MWSNTFEFLVLLSAIILTIYAVHKSKLRLLKQMASSEQILRETNEAIGSINPSIELLRELNFKFERYNQEIKSKGIPCVDDNSKECDYCGKGGDNCLVRKGVK